MCDVTRSYVWTIGASPDSSHCTSPPLPLTLSFSLWQSIHLSLSLSIDASLFLSLSLYLFFSLSFPRYTYVASLSFYIYWYLVWCAHTPWAKTKFWRDAPLSYMLRDNELGQREVTRIIRVAWRVNVQNPTGCDAFIRDNATHCKILKHTATYATHCSILQHTAPHWHINIWHLAHGVTHSYATWLICDMSDSHLTWPIHMRRDLYVTWRIHMWHLTHWVTHSCVWLDDALCDIFVCVTWRIHLSWDSCTCVTWFMHVCDVTHSCVRRDSRSYVHVCDVTHS